MDWGVGVKMYSVHNEVVMGGLKDGEPVEAIVIS
jgi:hypothetical protein